MPTIITELDLLVKMTITAWDAQNKQLYKLINELTNDQWQKEVAPGKNRGIYLLGHLIAINDAMLPILGFGEILFPGLHPVFIKNADGKNRDIPAVAELKQNLDTINAVLTEHIQATTALQWFERHTVVSAEDFAKEPHRNKLNVIISRTNHMAYHLGQLQLLK